MKLKEDKKAICEVENYGIKMKRENGTHLSEVESSQQPGNTAGEWEN